MELDLEKVSERIVREFEGSVVIDEVFPGENEQARLLQSLSVLSTTGSIKAGGRRVRGLLGCKTYDFSKDVIWDAGCFLSESQEFRLGPLVQVLKDFPEERMINPDLDFFTENIPIDQIAEVLKNNGFDVETHIVSSGGFKIVRVKGSAGIASFIDSNDSWQTQPPWPMFAAFATYSSLPKPQFNLNIGHGRMYEYPLEFSGDERICGDPLDPKRFAAVARILLWSVTVTNPDGNRLALPCSSSQEAIFETVSQLPRLLKKIKEDQNLKKTYNSGVRDMALALRIIELSDWEELYTISQNFTSDERDFMKYISSCWWQGRFIMQQENA